jgi:hypothetical protein
MIESVDSLVADEIDGPTVPTVPTGRASAWDKLLAPEGDTAITSTSTLDMNEGFIDEGQFWIALDARPLAGEPRRADLVGRHHIHEGASPAPILELDDAVRLGKERVVLAQSHVDSGEELCPPLAYQDSSTANGLTAKPLDPKMLGIGVAPVTAGSLSFFVCHDPMSSSIKP